MASRLSGQCPRRRTSRKTKTTATKTTEGAAIRNHNHNEIRNGSQASDEHGKAHAQHKNSNKKQQQQQYVRRGSNITHTHSSQHHGIMASLPSAQ
jgi:hypothetical protein